MVKQVKGYHVCGVCGYRYADKENAEMCENNCRSGTFDPDLESRGLPPGEEVIA
jgi:hypothetical protein|tara:strand:- start:651 stop:812 length:162 start_codon:yes stop_codon:yes gene_type:complete